MKFQFSIFLKEIENPCSPGLRCFRSFSYKPFLKPLNVSRPKLHLRRLIIRVHPILSKPFQHSLFIQSFLRVNTQFPHLPLGDTHISPQTAWFQWSKVRSFEDRSTSFIHEITFLSGIYNVDDILPCHFLLHQQLLVTIMLALLVFFLWRFLSFFRMRRVNTVSFSDIHMRVWVLRLCWA